MSALKCSTSVLGGIKIRRVLPFRQKEAANITLYVKFLEARITFAKFPLLSKVSKRFCSFKSLFLQSGIDPSI